MGREAQGEEWLLVIQTILCRREGVRGEWGRSESLKSNGEPWRAILPHQGLL